MPFFFVKRDEWRFKAVLVRNEFEKNRDVKDLVKAERILAEGEQYYDRTRHPNPLQCNFKIHIFFLSFNAFKIIFIFSISSLLSGRRGSHARTGCSRLGKKFLYL